jgi:hypothetical protein
MIGRPVVEPRTGRPGIGVLAIREVLLLKAKHATLENASDSEASEDCFDGTAFPRRHPDRFDNR